MEPEFAPVVTPREILYHLPELISGREPVLANPVARRLMLANPECREALLAVARISAAFSPRKPIRAQVHSRRDLALQRVLTKLPKLNGLEIANLLFDLGTLATGNRARTQGWHLERSIDSVTTEKEARRRILARCSRLQDSRASETRSIISSRAARGREILELALSFVPGNLTIRFALETSAYYDDRAVSTSSLHHIANATHSAELRSTALGLCGRIYLDKQDIAQALDHYRAAHESYGFFAIQALDGALASALARDRNSFKLFFESLSKLASLDNGEMLRQQLLGDAKRWVTVSRSNPIAVREVMRCLGEADSAFADRLETES